MDIGHILSTVPPVVENIFIYLNKRELDSCSEVCELWRRVAETEKNRRKDIAWFFQGLKCSLHKEIHLNGQDCSRMMDEVSSVEDDLSMQFKDLKMKPVFCLTFMSNTFFNEFHRLFPSFEYPPLTKAKRMKLEDVIWKRDYLQKSLHFAVGQYLHEKCKTTLIIAPGIIGSQEDTSALEIEEAYGISGIMIPNVPGLQIFNCMVDEKHCDISKIVPENTNIKCLLVFSQTNASSSFNKIVQSCLLRENSRVAIGGALIERSDKGRCSIVAFCGRSVEAASVIIKPKDKDEIEKKLKAFEETGLLQDRCFAFMFACVARGFYSFKQYNLESSIFHKLYPNVPLQGVFGTGEIGINYLPNTSSESKNEVLRIGKLTRPRKKYIHSYTTIFVLVSLKL